MFRLLTAGAFVAAMTAAAFAATPAPHMSGHMMSGHMAPKKSSMKGGHMMSGHMAPKKRVR